MKELLEALQKVNPKVYFDDRVNAVVIPGWGCEVVLHTLDTTGGGEFYVNDTSGG